jgi:quercetin dioxygenase-like cupin family protein
MLLAMRAAGRFEEHSTPGPISSVVRGGRILFAAGGEAGPGTVLTCGAGVRHAVEALGTVCDVDVARGGRLGSTTP